MSPTLIIVEKEVRDGLRNKWVLAVTLLLAALALSLGFLGSAPTGSVKVDPLTVTVVSLSSLSIFLVPLIAMLLSYDAIVGEVERGTMALLLSHPVTRWQVVVGKFFGHVTILGIATIVGYGLAGVVLQLAHGGVDFSTWTPFFFLIVASVLLGASFLSMGYLISSVVQERATAAGIAIGVWLFLVVIYDMALLGILVADQGRMITSPMLNTILLFNPTDVYRLLNLTGYENVSMFAGMAGLSEQARIPLPILFGVQLLWIIVPFALAVLAFRRKAL